MNILFIHQNFPGQFRHLAGFLAADPRNHVIAICQQHAPGLPNIPNKLVYTPARKPAPGIHHYLQSMESGILNGQAVAKLLLQLKKSGYVPDIVIAHPGWGEALYVKDIFPASPLLSHFEFYYHADGADVNFDPEYPLELDDRLRIRTRNALHLLNLEACDAGISPTQWQKSLHPAEFHPKISVIHEGIDTAAVVPNAGQTFKLPNGTVLTTVDEVITYVARNLEPYRGFHIFMRAVEQICRRRPRAQVVIVGGDGVSYGKRLPQGQTHRQKMLQEVDIDPARVHFLGQLPYADYLALLQVSSAHIYLTVPFVLSWSMLEAMSAGCLVIGSDTPPVREVLEHGRNGLLVDFFSPGQIADAVDQVFAHPSRMQPLREVARQTVMEHYDVRLSLTAYLNLINATLPRSPAEFPGLNEVSFQDNLQAAYAQSRAQIMVPIAAKTLSATSEAGLVADSDIRLNKNTELQPKDAGLSPREMEILQYLAHGKGDKVISDVLRISVKTVNRHVGNIILKLDATSRTHAVAKASKARLIEMRSTDEVGTAHTRRFGEQADKIELN
jgi:glycosyltransferase involved in cell wall biosynthesis/DNA-binding CsgD family transcriptional regulator